MNNPYKQYQKTQVITASKEKILLMLYEGAVRFTKQAIVAMDAKKVAEKGKCISKATAILSELMATLDFKIGGQLAVDLENLYVFMIDKMIEGNINNDIQCLKHVEKILMTLHMASVLKNCRARRSWQNNGFPEIPATVSPFLPRNIIPISGGASCVCFRPLVWPRFSAFR